MIFQVIHTVLLTPTNFCFHDQVINSLLGVFFGIKWWPLNIGLLKRAQKYEIFFRQLEMWNQQMFLDIPFLERHQDWDTLTQKLDNYFYRP